MKTIDFTRYNLTNPNITGNYIIKKEGITRETLYRNLRDKGISLSGRGLSDVAKKAMVGKKWRKNMLNPFKSDMTRHWKRWRTGADNRRWDFNISYEDIVNLFKKQKGRCALSGEKLRILKENQNISLDRIDSKVDYNIKNVQLVTKNINYMKQSLSQKEFIRLCKMVVNNGK